MIGRALTTNVPVAHEENLVYVYPGSLGDVVTNAWHNALKMHKSELTDTTA